MNSKANPKENQSVWDMIMQEKKDKDDRIVKNSMALYAVGVLVAVVYFCAIIPPEAHISKISMIFRVLFYSGIFYVLGSCGMFWLGSLASIFLSMSIIYKIEHCVHPFIVMETRYFLFGTVIFISMVVSLLPKSNVLQTHLLTFFSKKTKEIKITKEEYEKRLDEEIAKLQNVIDRKSANNEDVSWETERLKQIQNEKNPHKQSCSTAPYYYTEYQTEEEREIEEDPFKELEEQLRRDEEELEEWVEELQRRKEEELEDMHYYNMLEDEEKERDKYHDLW